MPKLAQKMAMIAAANGAAQLVTHAMAQKPSGQTVGYPSATQAGHNQYQAYAPPQTYTDQQTGGGYGTQQGYYGQSYPQHQQSNAPPYPQGNSYPNAPGGRPTSQELEYYRALLRHTVQYNKLGNFYNEGQGKFEEVMRILATEGNNKIQQLMTKCNVPKEIAIDMLQLILFDVILFVDDSGSIEFEERGLRKNQLIEVLSAVATAAAIMDQDGISVRFMNALSEHDSRANGIRNAEDVKRLMKKIKFDKQTPLGSSLKRKVVDPMVVQPAKEGRLQKPVLVITITDGAPVGEPMNSLQNTVKHAFDKLSQTASGPKAVTFQFAQVGTDRSAHEFLRDLDTNRETGHLVDCTSYYELEQKEMAESIPPFKLTPEVWRAKLMLGSIDYEYDKKDESGHSGASQKPLLPPGGFGGYVPPQNQAYGPAFGAPAASQGYNQYSQTHSSGQSAYGHPQNGYYNQAPSYNQSGAQGWSAYDQPYQYSQTHSTNQLAYGHSDQYSQYNQTPYSHHAQPQPNQYSPNSSYHQPGAQGQGHSSQGYAAYGPQY